MIVQIKSSYIEDQLIKFKIEEVECDYFITHANYTSSEIAGTIIKLYKDNKSIGDYGIYQLYGCKSTAK